MHRVAPPPSTWVSTQKNSTVRRTLCSLPSTPLSITTDQTMKYSCKTRSFCRRPFQLAPQPSLILAGRAQVGCVDFHSPELSNSESYKSRLYRPLQAQVIAQRKHNYISRFHMRVTDCPVRTGRQLMHFPNYGYKHGHTWKQTPLPQATFGLTRSQTCYNNRPPT